MRAVMPRCWVLGRRLPDTRVQSRLTVGTRVKPRGCASGAEDWNWFGEGGWAKETPWRIVAEGLEQVAGGLLKEQKKCL